MRSRTVGTDDVGVYYGGTMSVRFVKEGLFWDPSGLYAYAKDLMSLRPSEEARMRERAVMVTIWAVGAKDDGRTYSGLAMGHRRARSLTRGDAQKSETNTSCHHRGPSFTDPREQRRRVSSVVSISPSVTK